MESRKNMFSTIEVACILDMSRIAVFKNIQSGKIKAEKAGRNYIIKREDLIEDIMRDSLPLNAHEGEKETLREEIEEMIDKKHLP